LDCDRRFEVFQSMNDEPLKTCEACNGRLKRLIGTGAGIIFKGSGFYCTDYRSESYKKDAKKAKTPSSSSGSSGSDAKSKASKDSATSSAQKESSGA